jgi:hypothetical protein
MPRYAVAAAFHDARYCRRRCHLKSCCVSY